MWHGENTDIHKREMNTGILSHLLLNKTDSVLLCQVSVLSVWTICPGVSWVQLHHGRFSPLSDIGLN